jgi:hypothetical protein
MAADLHFCLARGALPKEAEMPEPQESRKPRRQAILRMLLVSIAFFVGFLLFGFLAVRIWDYSNSPIFCAQVCHDVHPEETLAYQDSYHANVNCVECHMGRVSMLQNILLKMGHFRHVPETLLGWYDRPMESETLRPANESCELCHWPPAFHGDTVREIVRFLPDEENSKKHTYLILRTGAGTRDEGLGYGIHWHITNPVEYIAADNHKEEIRWVRTTLPDGRTVEYNDVINPLSPEEIEQAEKHVMDCVDCHNRMGHPFPPPGELIHQALDDGRLSQDLPFAKKEMLDLLRADHANREEALAAVEGVRERYEIDYPEVAAENPESIEQAYELGKEFVARLVFDEPGVTWQDFPDHMKHKDFPGCFRCHDGKHLSAEGESIRLHCNICHSIPVTLGAGDRPPDVPIKSIQEPPSHLDTNFVADHRFQANSACVECHGEIEFGSDDSSFCAKSDCHGRAWPMAKLDAAFPHPIELEGKHAEAWCHDCHEGVREPGYECANCHQPPMEPHFGGTCEDCHTPAGFTEADLGDFEHPAPLEGSHASLSCSSCHTAGEELSSECAGCHDPPRASHFSSACQDCHTTTTFEDATLAAEDHPVPLEGAHLRATCDVCHAAGLRVPKYVCSNCHRPPASHLDGTCDTCHDTGGWVESASALVNRAPQITHDLEGREDCLLCHDPEGQVKPAPSSHADYVSEQCALCHKTAP